MRRPRLRLQGCSIPGSRGWGWGVLFESSGASGDSGVREIPECTRAAPSVFVLDFQYLQGLGRYLDCSDLTLNACPAANKDSGIRLSGPSIDQHPALQV